jgi:hypothetical protein
MRFHSLCAAALALLAVAAPARASFTLDLTSGAQSVSIADGGSLDQNSTTGAIGFTGNVNGLQINTLTGQRLPSGSLATQTFSIANTTNSEVTMQIWLTNTAFTSPSSGTLSIESVLDPVGVARTAGSGAGTASASIQFSGHGSSATSATAGPIDVSIVRNGSNQFFAYYSHDPVTGEPITGSADPQAWTATSDLFSRATPTSPYTMQNSILLTLGANSQIQFSASTTALAPEPASMGIALTGLATVLGYGLRRRKQPAV